MGQTYKSSVPICIAYMEDTTHCLELRGPRHRKEDIEDSHMPEDQGYWTDRRIPAGGVSSESSGCHLEAEIRWPVRVYCR